MTPPGTQAPHPGQPPPRRRRGYWLPGLIAMIALLLIGLAVGAGDLQHRAPGSLSGPDVATQISLGIQAAEHYRAPPAVTCPAQEPVRNGWTFTCRESQGGVSQMVLVTEIDGRGRLKWQIQPVL